MEVAGHIRWRGMLAATASVTAVGIGIGLSVPLLSTILELRGYSATLIGLNTATAGLASIAITPFVTPLAQRFGVVRVLIISIVLAAISLCMFYFAPSIVWWFPLRIIFHSMLNIIFILSEFWISSSAPSERRGMVLGIYGTVLSAGFAIGPWLFAVLGSSGFAAFGVGAAIILAAAIPTLFAASHSPVMTGKTASGGVIRYSFLIPTATAAVLLFGAVETGSFALFPVYGARIGYSEAEAALLISMIGVGNFVMQLPLGMLSDRVRDRRHVLIAISLIGLGGMLLLPSLGNNWALTAALMFIWGGATGGLYAVGLAHLSAKLSGKELADANAAFVFCYSVGMLIGPQIIGVGMDLAGPSGFAWTLAMFFAVYAVFAVYRSTLRP